LPSFHVTNPVESVCYALKVAKVLLFLDLKEPGAPPPKGLALGVDISTIGLPGFGCQNATGRQ